MSKREKICLYVCLFLIPTTCGVTRAAYKIGDYWDFQENFSSTQKQVLDSQNNIAWEYKGGNATQLPSVAVLLSPWNPAINGTGAWCGATSPNSWIGKGFMKAWWESFGTEGTGDRSPFLVWESHVDASISVDINVIPSSVSDQYRASVFINDILQEVHSGDVNPYGYSKNKQVHPGDNITLRISPDFWGISPLVNVDFKVTMLTPEPTTCVLMLAGGMGLIRRRRFK